jgi:hypothetical protein
MKKRCWTFITRLVLSVVVLLSTVCVSNADMTKSSKKYVELRLANRYYTNCKYAMGSIAGQKWWGIVPAWKDITLRNVLVGETYTLFFQCPPDDGDVEWYTFKAKKDQEITIQSSEREVEL